MNLNLQLAGALAVEIPMPDGGQWNLRTVSDMKLRTFIPPGEPLELEAKIGTQDENSALVIVETRKGKRLAGSARVLFSTEGNS